MENALIASSDRRQFEDQLNEKMKEITEQNFQVLDIKFQAYKIDLRPRYNALIMFAHKDEIKNMARTTKY